MENELTNKSAQLLELDAVLRMLAEKAASQPAKGAALKLTPQDNLWEIKEGLVEVETAKSMIVLKGSPALQRVTAVGEYLDRAERGGMLGTRELMKVADVMRAARTVRAYGRSERGGETRLDYLFHALRGNKYLEDRITGAILGEDELADSASSDLASIRRLKRAAGARVKDILQKIISSSAYSKALQDPIITLRADRYVVPVKAESRSMIPGLVHDVSASGATVFIEPMSVVEANNEIRELSGKEDAEIERILIELSAEVAGCKEDIASDYDILVSIDLIFAKANLAFDMNAAPVTVTKSGSITLKKARHPLLPVKTAVPIDITLGEQYDTLVITGPNTGGKTVSIKTLGLLCLMVRCSLHIPVADGSSVPIFTKVLADIGDEQSIEQSLSTFSSHMTNIVKILGECDDSTLLLLDELGAGTDPVEGAALAISIIEYARNRSARIAATTHYSELKAYATLTKGVMNASCEFDVQTLRPTYRLLTGIPGKSNAFAISGRLGIPQSIIDDAQSRISAENAGFGEMIGKLEQQRIENEQLELEAAKHFRQAEEDSKKALAALSEIERTRGEAIEAARREAAEIIMQARQASDEVMDEMRRAQKLSAKNGDFQQINQARASIRGRLNQAEAGLHGAAEKAQVAENTRPIAAGDTVELISTGSKAQVISVKNDGTLNLQAGILKITAVRGEVRLLEGEEADTPKDISARSAAKLRTMATPPDLDVRGMTGEEAIPVIERYLDSAGMSGLEIVTIIHGKGTGALRKAVHTELKRMTGIKSFRLGKYGEGEDGVTIVEL